MCVRVRVRARACVRACMSNRRGCICVYNLLNQKRDTVLTAVIFKEHYWAERTDMRPMRSWGVKALSHQQPVLLQFTLPAYCKSTSFQRRRPFGTHVGRETSHRGATRATRARCNQTFYWLLLRQQVRLTLLGYLWFTVVINQCLWRTSVCCWFSTLQCLSKVWQNLPPSFVSVRTNSNRRHAFQLCLFDCYLFILCRVARLPICISSISV